MTYKIGTEIEGEVTGIQPYGAFVSLPDGDQGLIHISEVKNGYIKSITDVLKPNQKVKVKIIDIDEYTKKISLSMRVFETVIPVYSSKKKKFFTNRHKKIGFSTLEKKLPLWTNEAFEKFTNK